MSSVIGEDTANTINSGRAAVGSTLAVVQEHLQKAFIVFVVGMMGTIMAMRAFVWAFLKETATSQIRPGDPAFGNIQIIAQTPFDVILLQVKIGAIVGAIMAAVALLVIIREDIKARAGRVVEVTAAQFWGLVGLATVLFFAGLLYAYQVFFPFMFAFLANNAMQAAIQPKYGIVEFTEFMALLTISFGIAAELPLIMSALAYTEIVSYEFFRDKWRYAVITIFVVGAVASPPDPFTQIMWGIPLCALYAFSLGLAKVVTNIRRGADGETGALKAKVYQLLALFVLGTVLAAGAILGGAFEAFNQSVTPALPELLRFRLLAPQSTVGVVTLSLSLGALAATTVVAAFVVQALQQPVVPRNDFSNVEDPADIDLSALDQQGIEAAPVEAFQALEEETALSLARGAMQNDDPDRAQAILDRFDEAQAVEAAEDGDGEGAPMADSVEAGADDEAESGVFANTAAGMVDPFTEDETTEDDIGGYLYDIRFIFESLTSRLFRIVGVFMAVMFSTFFWLYSGGIGDVLDQFLSRIPQSAIARGIRYSDEEIVNLLKADIHNVPTESPTAVEVFAAGGDLGVIALHPVEALIFEVKVSAIIGALAVLPVLLYYAWPALKERGLARGDRRVFGVWAVSLFVGFVVGSILGFYVVAPEIVSYLVWDALQAEMIIAYRLKSFFWLVFLLTGGIGLLFDVPVTMVLFHYGGIVSFERMWQAAKPVVFAIFVFAMLATSSSLLTMFIIAVPIVIAFLVGLAVLWLLTLPSRTGRRLRSAPGS
jgi:sec-independent protein translocase protein TatC